MKAYEWKPIEDLPANWTKLASSELAGLASVWREHYETIKDSKALKQFNERLRREWAIETGIIENLYYIDRGVTLTLIEKGIEASLIPHGTTDKPAELIVPILKDQEEVVIGLFDFVGQQRHLSTSYIKQLHQALTQHQRTTAAKDSFGQMIEVELLRGDWKRLPNNPTKSDGSIHEYCPPEQVASEMDQLIAWHQEHLENQVPPEVEAAWLHHRFTQIHPFQDGNGRMARTLASLIFLRAGLFPLVIHRDERDEYIDALEIADKGELGSLVQLLSRLQKKAINQVVSLSETILFDINPLEQVIRAAATKLKDKKHLRLGLIATQEMLKDMALTKIKIVMEGLHDKLKAIDEKYAAGWMNADQSSAALNHAVEEIAEKLGYYADTRSYSSFVTMLIFEGRHTQIYISFHAVGRNFSGVMSASAFAIEVIDNDESSSFVSDAVPICKEVFQFSANEPIGNIKERFQTWLDDVILMGLDYWQRQL